MPQTFAVVAETKDGSARKITLEMLAEARRLLGETGGGTVVAIVPGPLADGEAGRLAQQGADRVMQVEGTALATYGAEAHAEAVRKAALALKPDLLLIGGTAQGKDLAPRVASMLGTGLVTDCVGFQWKEGALLARRPIYAGKALATVAWSDMRPAIASIRPNTFQPTAPDPARNAAVESIPLGEVAVRARVAGFEKSEGEELDLTEANVIVSGGRAMGGPENFEILRKLCKAVGGTLGASRAAVDAGWIDHHYQVGQTGKVVNPTLYIAVGISGAIQHLAGMSSSRTIVAINKDREAPIFKVATYGIVGDLYQVVPALTSEFERALRE
jgi:electron transfer flavoprotein alpha subunit